jgi:hypothetical protein
VDFRDGGFLEAIFGAKEYGIIKIKNAFCTVADNSPRHSPPPPPNSKRQLGEEWTDFLWRVSETEDFLKQFLAQKGISIIKMANAFCRVYRYR